MYWLAIPSCFPPWLSPVPLWQSCKDSLFMHETRASIINVPIGKHWNVMLSQQYGHVKQENRAEPQSKALLSVFIRFILANVSNSRKPKTGFYSIFASFGLSKQFFQRDPASNNQPQKMWQSYTCKEEPQPILEVLASLMLPISITVM